MEKIKVLKEYDRFVRIIVRKEANKYMDIVDKDTLYNEGLTELLAIWRSGEIDRCKGNKEKEAKIWEKVERRVKTLVKKRFMEHHESMVKSEAIKVAKMFRYVVDQKELEQEGMDELLKLYETSRIDWRRSEGEIACYKKQRVEGRMLNVVTKKIKNSGREKEPQQFKKPDGNPMEDIGDIPVPPSMTIDIEEDLIKKQFIEHLYECLTTIIPSPEILTIFKYHIIDERTFEEIGKILNASRETVRRKFTRKLDIEKIYKMLKKCLEAKGWTITDKKEVIIL